jgi:hypothetical protein
MSSGSRSLFVIGGICLVCLGPAALMSRAQQQQQQQPPAIDSYFPKQLGRGQTTVVTAAVGGRQVPQSAEISPAAGVTVTGIKRGGAGQGALGWWEVTVEVANDAAPGNRTLTLVTPAGRSNPLPITITSHGPTISALSVVSSQTNQPTVDLQLTAADTANDLGETPNVLFALSCGSEPEQGVVRGKLTGGVIRASIPNPRTQKGPGAPTAGPRCDLQVRVIDAAGTESNALKTTVEFRN